MKATPQDSGPLKEADIRPYDDRATAYVQMMEERAAPMRAKVCPVDVDSDPGMAHFKIPKSSIAKIRPSTWTLWLPVHAVAVELRELALTLRLISFVIVDYFTVKEVVLDDEDGYQIRLTPQLTGKGQQWLTRKLLDAGLLKPVAAE